MKAAHPQHVADVGTPNGAPLEERPGDDVEPANVPAENGDGIGGARAAAESTLRKNYAFPSMMTVPDRDGTPIPVELAVFDGAVYAPTLDSLPLDPHVRQYVAQYCAAWSMSTLTTSKLPASWPFLDPPRRGQLRFTESQLHAMLGLASDESLVGVVVDPLSSAVRFIVESPRLIPKQWNCEPPLIGLPISAWYEGRQGDGDPRGAAAAQRQLDSLRERATASRQEWTAAIEDAQRRVTAAQQAEGQVPR